MQTDCTLDPLSPQDTQELLQTFFGDYDENLTQLSALVHRQTYGNPFFILAYSAAIAMILA